MAKGKVGDSLKLYVKNYIAKVTLLLGANGATGTDAGAGA